MELKGKLKGTLIEGDVHLQQGTPLVLKVNVPFN